MNRVFVVALLCGCAPSIQQFGLRGVQGGASDVAPAEVPEDLPQIFDADVRPSSLVSTGAVQLELRQTQPAQPPARVFAFSLVSSSGDELYNLDLAHTSNPSPLPYGTIWKATLKVPYTSAGTSQEVDQTRSYYIGAAANCASFDGPRGAAP